MLVPDEIRKCVVFVCYSSTKGTKLAGTGFFVALPSSASPDMAYPYLVTAKHVVEAIKKKTNDGKVYVRINQKGNASTLITTDLTQWRYHPTQNNIDVAVIALAPDQSLFDYLVLPSGMAVTPEIITNQAVGCGDEVFLTGLFSNHYGQNRNIPIIRIGNIACMPEEMVQTKNLGAIEAYLVEARSIGGLSGSPVFVHLSGVRRGTLSLGNGPIYWLGLMHGHFDLSELEVSDEVEQDTLINLQINMGIAIVIPASKVMEVINQEEFVNQRKIEDEEARLKKAATPDA